MSTPNSYYPGAKPVLTALFVVGGNAEDPTTLTLTLVSPDETVAPLNYSASITRLATGSYAASIDTTGFLSGMWTYQFAASGAVQDVQEGQFFILSSAVVGTPTTPVPPLVTALSVPYLYTPEGWNAAWLAAKAASGGAPASVIALGDSITQGAYSTSILTTSWWALLRAYLLSAHTLGGDYYGMLYSARYGGPFGGTTPPIVVSGSVDFQAYGGYNTVLFDGTNPKTALYTFTTPYACTAVDIVYDDYATGTPSWTYAVDGGAAQNVNTTGPGTGAGAILKKISLTGLALGVHTIVINGSGAGANTVAILGFACYPDATKGVRFANHGWGGQGLVASSTAHNYLNDTTGVGGIDRVALYQGYTGTTASPATLSGFGFPTQPDLAVIAFGVNDAAQSANATTFRDALRRLVQSLRYGKSDACSILIVSMYTGDATTASSTVVTSTDYTGSQTPGIEDLREAMRNVAEEYGCAYAAVHGLFGRMAVTNGWVQSATNVHPTDAGYAKIAALLEQVL